jgi:hypothetical protein
MVRGRVGTFASAGDFLDVDAKSDGTEKKVTWLKEESGNSI